MLLVVDASTAPIVVVVLADDVVATSVLNDGVDTTFVAVADVDDVDDVDDDDDDDEDDDNDDDMEDEEVDDDDAGEGATATLEADGSSATTRLTMSSTGATSAAAVHNAMMFASVPRTMRWSALPAFSTTTVGVSAG